MTTKITRRTLLTGGLGAAGTLVCGRTLRAAESQEHPLPEQTDRSAEAPSSPVAVQRCDSYEPQALRQALGQALDLIGGIKELVQHKTVTVKLNLTGMTWDPVFGLPAQETYQTQPNTVAALCAILADAGARQIVLVENLYWVKPFEQVLTEAGWNLPAIQAAGQHKVRFEDTRNRGKFRGYSRFQVPWGGFVYPAFDMNQRFEQTDVLVSLAKLKQHATAGITGVVKNFFGNTPSSIYGDDGPGEHALKHRAAMFHGGGKQPPAGAPAELSHGLPKEGSIRVPRITADIYGARPADLGIVDGIRTIRGGEGHWNGGIGLIEPKLLVVGRNGVCTDSVCTAVMGFDPQAPHGHAPFQGDNHLRLLASVGVGTNDLRRIEVRGVPLADAVCPFTPRKSPS
ncbi:MAG: DUF362 domain-containing protein [Planctomycetota bacterium]|nr:DUF362 domain-containing protein [Planctomycetota bacterium]